jgi:hypothetical protein
MDYKYALQLVVFVLVLGLLIYWLYYVFFESSYKIFNTKDKITKASATKIQLQTIMIKLWMEHVMWSRSYIMSALYGCGDKSITLERLMQNQDSLGFSVGVFYGGNAGKQLTELLKTHINITVDIVNSVMTGDQITYDTHAAYWKTNADKIAKLLSFVNKTINYNKIQQMLYSHLELTTQEILAEYYRDWGSDIKAYDKIVYQALEIGRYLSDSICQEFNIQ